MNGILRCIILVSITFITASATYSQTATTKLNIVLHPIQTITVNPEQMATSLVYSTPEDYKQGVEVVQKRHLTVTSTGAYIVRVRLADIEYQKISGNTDKALRQPDIKVTASVINNGNFESFFSPMLAVQDRPIISSTEPSINQIYDVSYRGPGNNFFLDYLSKGETSVFTNTILYSIETR